MLVITASKEMDSIVLTSMSVHNKMNVAKMLNVVTLMDHIHVNATKAFKEMEKSVIISMSVLLRSMPVLKTPNVLIQVEVITVFVSKATKVMASSNV